MQARTSSLFEVAARADSLTRFGHELADWLHTLRALGSRPALAATIADAPTLLAGRFPEGALADATLAAYADLLAARIDVAPPAWCFARERIAPEPWFASEGPRGRLLALRDSPPAFKRRNLFACVPAAHPYPPNDDAPKTPGVSVVSSNAAASCCAAWQ